MAESNDVRFPCEVCPEDAAAARLLGLYPQRQPGLLMQRLKVHAGAITWRQWRAIAEIARTYTPGVPLHVTTRQDIELHGLTPEKVPPVQRALHAVGLTTLGACGDAFRNVTVCPGSGLCRNSFDLSPLSTAVRAAAEALPWIGHMPRKFKLSFSGCGKACGRPWINDLAFVAREDGWVRVIGAGSLGAKPGLGIELFDRLAASDVAPLTLAALTLFNAEGDRQNRTRARLRHVRERLGDEDFRQRLLRLFEEQKGRGGFAKILLTQRTAPPLSVTRFSLPFGDIFIEGAVRLADAAEKANATLRVGLGHNLFLYSPAPLELPADLAALSNRPNVAACPGTLWCSKGIVDCRAAAARIGEALPARSVVNICLNACPNNCGHAAIADIGLIGRIRNIGGVRTECFRVVAGGGNGKLPVLAEELHSAVPADAVDRSVASIVAAYQAERASSESFGEFVRRRKEHLASMLNEIAGTGDPAA